MEGGPSLPTSCNIVKKNYHQDQDTELRRLPKDVVANWGAVILRFHWDANVYK